MHALIHKFSDLEKSTTIINTVINDNMNKVTLDADEQVNKIYHA